MTVVITVAVMITETVTHKGSKGLSSHFIRTLQDLKTGSHGLQDTACSRIMEVLVCLHAWQQVRGHRKTGAGLSDSECFLDKVKIQINPRLCPHSRFSAENWNVLDDLRIKYHHVSCCEGEATHRFLQVLIRHMVTSDLMWGNQRFFLSKKWIFCNDRIGNLTWIHLSCISPAEGKPAKPNRKWRHLQ